MRKRRKLNYKNNRFIYGVIVLLVLVGMGIGFSYLTTSLNINGTTTVSKNTWNVHFQNLKVDSNSVTASIPATIDSTTTGVRFSVNLDQPGDIYSFTVDVVNSGSIDAMVSGLTKTNLTDIQSRYLEYIVTYSDGSAITEKELLKVGASRKVKVIVRYKKDITTEDLPTNTDVLNLSFNISYIQSDESAVQYLAWFIRKDAVADNIASEYVTASTGIDFTKISSDTNGKGVYLLSSTKNNTNPIYYYRGAVDNNNVKFANFCWKIVRTTETGGIKLIYNGSPDVSGYCTNSIGELSEIGKSAYNLNSSDNTYVGYMYGTAGSNSYEETHKNTNDSEIKKVIDNWYRTNMVAYTDKLEDTVWCNDRTVVKALDYTGDGTGTATTLYGPRDRLYVNKVASLECVNPNDRFTVNKANGNGALTYPVAMLTADEIVYAGGLHGMDNGNSTYYLYTKSWYWSLSPSHFDGGIARGGNMSVTGYVGNVDIMSSSGGVRPSISLKSDTAVIDGDGTANSPYIIK